MGRKCPFVCILVADRNRRRPRQEQFLFDGGGDLKCLQRRACVADLLEASRRDGVGHP